MRVAWIHDHPFYIGNDNKVYSKSGVDRSALERYLSYFDKIVVTGRLRESEVTKNMACCNSENIEFSLNKVYKSSIQYYIDKKKLRKSIKELVENVDCCLILLPSLLGLLAIDECKKMNKPYIIQVIGCIWDTLWNHGTLQSKIIAPILYLDTKRHIRNSKYVAYITNTFLQSRYPTKGKRGDGIANVNIKDISNEVLLKRLNNIISKDKSEFFKIGLIGSLDVRYKGHGTAIKALSIVKKKVPNIELHFLGSGNTEKWICFANKYGVKENVFFDGLLPSGEPVMEWFDKLDIYIQPSTSEGHGRSVVEAMSRGCPVFASKVGGLVDSLNYEYLFPSQNYKALADMIIKTITSKSFALNCAETNFKKSKKYEYKEIKEKRDCFFYNFIKENKLY